MSNAPPDHVIRHAVAIGAGSPCAKSKRGAAVFDPASGAVLGLGHNGQPAPLGCTGSVACREACGKLCVHAEVRAIRDALLTCDVDDPDVTASLPGLELVHAKVVNGLLVPGGGPSCWQCSREVLDVRLAAVWLYEQPVVRFRPTQGFFPQEEVFPDGEPRWVRYTAEEFHRVTLAACGLEVPR